MRGKRSKQYRKLIQQYGITFGFREPYQVLVDAEIIKDASRFAMDLIAGLERTLHGTVKPMITQCSMRHLYNASPKVPHLVEQAKTYERRRCNHHELDEPLSTLDCISNVVDGKSQKSNKHRYVIASQDADLRAFLRSIPGVPLVYINRSVMIMEPMAGITENVRDKDEKGKFRAGLKGKRGQPGLRKRKRDDDGDEGAPNGDKDSHRASRETLNVGNSSTTKKTRGPKGPNPLSVKKKRSKEGAEVALVEPASENLPQQTEPPAETETEATEAHTIHSRESATRSKRKRRHKPGSSGVGMDDGMTLDMGQSGVQVR
ncbi:MAG: hypothetical protein M1833_002542 [Piccolia ochrophora]|nr:MAG: hypothetical protein M1833_002542 [Piccolia ochrophora]